MPSFSDLPTELVVEIASFLSAFDDTTQISLAIVCRRFYAALIDMVLKDQMMEIEKLSSLSKITPPLFNHNPKYCGQCSTDTNRIAAHTSPPWESQIFNREKIGNSGTIKIIVSQMTRRNLQCLRYLVSRTRHLKKLVLEIYTASSTPEVQNIQDVACFINTCISRPDLILHIYGAMRGELQSPFIFHFEERLLSSNPSEVNTTPGPPSFSVTKRRHEIPEGSFLEPQISTLALEGGEIPFMLPLYPFILNALRGSTITCLKLKWIPFSITLFHWGQILPCISLPRLNDLTIGKTSIAFPDILSLLERHPTINTLDLSHNNVIGVVKLPSQPILPRLVSLVANSEYLLPFIEHKIRGHFPVLQTLHATPSINILGMTPGQFSYVENDLHPFYDLLSSTTIAKSHSKAFRVTISADGWGTLGLVKWLLHKSSTIVGIGRPDKNQKVISIPLAGVRELVIERADIWKSQELTDQLFEWFKIYRSSLDERMTGQEDFMDTKYLDMFEVLVWTTCSQLERLEIAGSKSEKRYVRDFRQ